MILIIIFKYGNLHFSYQSLNYLIAVLTAFTGRIVMLKRLTLFISLYLLGIGCSFEPGAEYFAEIDQVDLSQAEILFNVEDDTIHLYQSFLLEYGFTGPNIRAEYVTIYIDGNHNLGSWYTDGTQSMLINPRSYSTGYHTISFRFTLLPDNNSIGSVMNETKFYMERDLVFYADNEPPNPLQITGIDSLNGSLTIHWEQYTRTDFDHYRIYRNCNQVPGFLGICSTYFTISDQTTTHWTDHDFIAGIATYTVSVYTLDNAAFGTPVTVKIIPTITYHHTGSNITLTWSKPLLGNDLISVDISRNGQTVKSTSDLNDTTFTEPYPFGDYYGTYYLTFRKANQQYVRAFGVNAPQ